MTKVGLLLQRLCGHGAVRQWVPPAAVEARGPLALRSAPPLARATVLSEKIFIGALTKRDFLSSLNLLNVSYEGAGYVTFSKGKSGQSSSVKLQNNL